MAEAIDILERQVKDLERKRDDLEKDNAKQRDELREARGERDAASAKASDLEKKLPSEASITLSKADQERWQQYQALGKLDEVTTKVKGYDGLEAKSKRRDREDGIKALGLKPSIFELIAEGKGYRAEGEGEDRTLYLTVDEDGAEKEVELTEYASKRGLDDLLGVMGLEASKDTTPTPRTPTGAGNKKPQPRGVLSEEDAYKEKQSNPAYRA